MATRIDLEIPFAATDDGLIRNAAADQLASVAPSDVRVLHGRGHPDAASDAHVVGVIVPPEPADVSDGDVTAIVGALEQELGVTIHQLGDGQHDPDYLGDYQP